MLIALLAAFGWLISFSNYVSADKTPFIKSEEYMKGGYGNVPRQRYLSDPDVIGPVGNFLVPPKSGLSPSRYIFWTPFVYTSVRTHPTILDANTLAVVWVGPAHSLRAMGATVQSCNGSQYITWWSGNEVDNWMAGTQYVVWTFASQFYSSLSLMARP